MLKVDLSGKNAVVTGGGGVLCSAFSKALAECGAGGRVLDLNEEKAKEVASEINSSGGKAIGIGANVLSKESLIEAKKKTNDFFGEADILLNGRGGNSPGGTTTKEYYEPGDEEKEGLVTFFNLDPDKIGFVF